MTAQTTTVAVVGSSGYTGGELMRLLLGHRHVSVSAVTSEKSAGKPIAAIFPHLAGLVGLIAEPLDPGTIAKKADVIFLALPHVTAQAAAAAFLGLGKKIIDLSADFRLSDAALYESWYEHCHQHPDLLPKAVYGLTELRRDQVRNAALVANPGCYPTGAILGLAPLVRSGAIRPDTIVIDSKSGVSGAGRSPSLAHHFPEVNEAFMAYKIGTHRHTPEIEQELTRLAGAPVTVQFTPHLVPMNRGILTTIYANLAKPLDPGALRAMFETAYGKEPFVRLMPPGEAPNVRNVRGSNFCDVNVFSDRRTNRVVVVTAIDNLVKGAAGQAVQNMNVMLGIDEREGLWHAGTFP